MKIPKVKKEFSEQEAKTRKQYKIELIISLISALLIEIYFIVLNIISTSTTIKNFDICIKISYMAFIFIGIIIFEIAYKKEKKKLAVIGIEFIVLAIHTLLIGLSITTSSNLEKIGILSTSYIWLIYHAFKAIIIYTKENRRRLKQISDIAEIVKEEKPTKKVAKKRKT